jgi:hypothetical protein
MNLSALENLDCQIIDNLFDQKSLHSNSTDRDAYKKGSILSSKHFKISFLTSAIGLTTIKK